MAAKQAEAVERPCEQCPWRTANQGTKHPYGFYTKKNLTRLWNQIRKGGSAQSCHLTDPAHPDHVAAGCAENAVAKECPGSVILVLRELTSLQPKDKSPIDPEHADAYLKRRKRGLTKYGLWYWLVSRITFGGVPLMGGPKLPNVNIKDPAIDLPAHLKE